MRPKVIFNGSLIDAEEALIPACSSGVLTGRGNFTTIAIRNGKPRLWDYHRARLVRDSLALGIDVSFDEIEILAEGIERLSKENGITDGKARITMIDGNAPSRWPLGISGGPQTLIQTSESARTGDLKRIGISPIHVNESSPLAGIKTVSYEEPLTAFEEASGRGLDEAIRLDSKDRVSCGCLSNLFWVSAESGRLRTPALTTGCIRGTTREYILSRIDVEEVEFNVNTFFADAGAVFFTSAVRWISPALFLEDIGGLGPLPSQVAELPESL